MNVADSSVERLTVCECVCVCVFLGIASGVQLFLVFGARSSNQ